MIKKFFGAIKRFYARVFATNKIAGIGLVLVSLWVLYSIGIFVYSSFNPIQQRDKSLPDISTMEISTTVDSYNGNEKVTYVSIQQIGDSITVDVEVKAGTSEDEAIKLAIEVIHQFEADQGWVIPEGNVWSEELKQFELNITIDTDTDSDDDDFPLFGSKMQNNDTINWLDVHGNRKAM